MQQPEISIHPLIGRLLLDVRIPKKVANIFKKIIPDKNTPEIVQIL